MKLILFVMLLPVISQESPAVHFYINGNPKDVRTYLYDSDSVITFFLSPGAPKFFFGKSFVKIYPLSPQKIMSEPTVVDLNVGNDRLDVKLTDFFAQMPDYTVVVIEEVVVVHGKSRSHVKLNRQNSYFEFRFSRPQRK
jgi:hypothetical protein